MKIIRRTNQHNYHFSHLDPVMNELLKKRPFYSEMDVDLSLKHLLPYHSLSNIDEATKRVVKAICDDEHIMIVGDYDVDGATSIALAIRVLREFGVQNLTYTVPHRILDGYGLTRSLVSKIDNESPDLLITVDNGISNYEGVAYAKSLGMDVIITDHHLPPETLPPADAIINPNLENDPFESKMLAGVGVIFYLLLSVRASLQESQYFQIKGINPPNLAQYLDLVALGTISDVVPMDANNRRLVQQGLARIRSGKTIAGIRALIEISGRNQRSLSTSDIGFGVAPLLNAAGRLDNMTIGIETLLTDERAEADQYARELYNLNQERREIEAETRHEADRILDAINLDEANCPNVICLYDESWHQGITGIVASRIKDQYYRPTFIFAYDNEGLIKGSGRSIKGIHIRDCLSNVATQYPDLIYSFGGHAMAAGLSIEIDRFHDFQIALNEEIEAHLSAETFNQVIHSDGALPVEAYNLEMAEMIRLALPWGQEFPEPLFDDQFNVVDFKILKDQHVKFRVQHQQSKIVYDAIAFFQAHTLVDNVRQIHCAFKLDINEWRGRRNLQLIIDYFTPFA